MAATLTGFECVRRVLRGVSGPQPLGGTAQRAAEAYEAMAGSAWLESDDGPTVPPHHYDTASPAPGDAYRQTFGYSATNRTERSACGAVCYSVKIPADALAGDPCSVASVEAKLVGDRYLECGAIMAAILSDDANPPDSWASVLAAASTSALLSATSAEANVKPNKRSDKTATATVSLSAPAMPYLHLVLRVADYLAFRDAWHEGGAMLDPSTVSVAFSRDVVPDDASAPAAWLAPETEDGDEGAMSRTGNVFASLTWPGGLAAGLAGDDLRDAALDILAAPYCAADNVFNGHHAARLGRWPMASGTSPDGDYALVGALRAVFEGETFPWPCGFVAGMRVRLRGRHQQFRTLSFGAVPAAAMKARVAIYSAGTPPASSGLLRLSTPSAALLDWQRLFDGTAAELPFAEGAALALEPVAAFVLDLADGLSSVPCPVFVRDAATLVVAVAPHAPQNYAETRWPLSGWTLL